MLVIRVETDWYPHESEFRYVLQPGEGIDCAHNIPIGQVFFVPREEITCAIAPRRSSPSSRRPAKDYFREKAATKQTTAYGLQYSPLYLRHSRSHKT